MKLSRLKYRLHIYFFLNQIKNRLRKYGFIKEIETVSDTFYEDCTSGKIPIHELWLHANSNNEKIQLAIATAPNCPPELIKQVLKTATTYIKYKIVENKKDCTCDFLRLVYNNSLLPDDYAVRTQIMIHPLCPMDIRKEIMSDPDCQPFIGEIPNLQEYYIRTYFDMDYHIKKTMCALQFLPYDMVETVLKGNDKTLITLLHHNEKLKSYFESK